MGVMEFKAIIFIFNLNIRLFKLFYGRVIHRRRIKYKKINFEYLFCVTFISYPNTCMNVLLHVWNVRSHIL